MIVLSRDDVRSVLDLDRLVDALADAMADPGGEVRMLGLGAAHGADDREGERRTEGHDGGHDVQEQQPGKDLEHGRVLRKRVGGAHYGRASG